MISYMRSSSRIYLIMSTAEVKVSKSKRKSIYPRKCEDCGVVYKYPNSYLSHRSIGTCLHNQRRQLQPEPTIAIDEITGERYVEFLIYKGRLANATVIGTGKLSLEDEYL